MNIHIYGVCCVNIATQMRLLLCRAQPAQLYVRTLYKRVEPHFQASGNTAFLWVEKMGPATWFYPLPGLRDGLAPLQSSWLCHVLSGANLYLVSFFRETVLFHAPRPLHKLFILIVIVKDPDEITPTLESFPNSMCFSLRASSWVATFIPCSPLCIINKMAGEGRMNCLPHSIVVNLEWGSLCEPHWGIINLTYCRPVFPFHWKSWKTQDLTHLGILFPLFLLSLPLGHESLVQFLA